MIEDMRSAPKDGTMILLHRGFEGPPVSGYWYKSPRVKWWMSCTGGWVNSVVGWEHFPREVSQ